MAPKECASHPRSMLDSMNALKNHEEFCDITIMAGQDEIKVHKFVLIAASEYFRAMFSNDTKESKTGIVSFPDTPGDVVKQCINFIYTGKADFSLDCITDFIKASDMFCLHDLTNLYVEFLSVNVTMDNVEEMLSVARVYHKELLKTSIQIFFRDNLKAYIVPENLQSLSKDNFLYLLSLVHSWGMEYEMLKWNAIVTWVKEELDERKDAFFDLFDTIDFKFLPRQFVKDHIIHQQLVSESAELMVKICDTVLDEKPSKLPMLPIEKSTGIISCNGDTRLMYRYSLIEEEWSVLTQLPEGIATECLDVVEYKGIIYVTNGNAIYSFSGMGWKKLYESDSAAQYNRCIGCGKYVSMVTEKCAVFYEIGTGETSSVKIKRDEEQPCSDFAIASTGDCIYIVGGGTGWFSQYQYTAFMIKLKTMQCIRISNIPINVNKCNGCVFEFNGTVYAFSGCSVEVVFYNGVENKWQCVEDFTIKHSVGCKVHVSDKLYLYGGMMGTLIQTVELEKLIVPEKDERASLKDVDMSVFCMSFLK